jgi:hypothetical protein
VKIPWKVLVVCVPLAGGGGWFALDASRQLAQADEAGRVAGESYVRTLQGAHAERQLEELDHRRALARELFVARRNRVIGLLAVGAAVLVGWGAVVLGRISTEVDEQRRMFEG